MTDIILNQLYPGGVMKQLADAAGGIVYDQYAAGGCVGQLYTAAGADVTLDQYAPGGPLHQIEVELEGGDSGDTPEWVPDNAVIHIDLVGGDPQGRAWVQGTGIVAVDTLLGADANTENSQGETSYDPEALTVDGYVRDNGAYVAAIGSLRTALLAGATSVFRIKQVSPTGTPRCFLSPVAADGADALQVSLNLEILNATLESWGGSFSEEITGIVNVGQGTAINVVAMTYTGSRFELAVNGSDAVAGTLDATDKPPGNPFVAFVIGHRTDALQSITLYDALPSTAGLSELSEVP